MCKIYNLKNTLKQEIYICMYVREMYQQGNTKEKNGKHKSKFNNKNNLFKIDENRLNITIIMQII